MTRLYRWAIRLDRACRTTMRRAAIEDLNLQVWDGTFHVRVPIYATGELASETRPLDRDKVSVDLSIRFQACDHEVCLLPRTATIRLELPRACSERHAGDISRDP